MFGKRQIKESALSISIKQALLRVPGIEYGARSVKPRHVRNDIVNFFQIERRGDV
jgi:hypothetical protein